MATKKSAVKDLTNGSPVKLILGFALPLLLGMLFQQFYSMVDTIIVGKFLGAKALAAVGSTGRRQEIRNRLGGNNTGKSGDL